MIGTRRGSGFLVVAICLAAAGLAGCGGGGESGELDAPATQDPPGAQTPPPGSQVPPPADPDPATPGNRAPEITGAAPAVAIVGEPFSFRPAASDADNDPLTFTIANKPDWASFDSSTGELAGTPEEPGTYADIEIAATDGKSVTALPAFTLTVQATAGRNAVTIAWAPPTENTDGTPLEGLAGFRIHYGSEPSSYSQFV